MKFSLGQRIIRTRNDISVTGTVCGYIGPRYYVSHDVLPLGWLDGNPAVESELSELEPEYHSGSLVDELITLRDGPAPDSAAVMRAVTAIATGELQQKRGPGRPRKEPLP